MLVRTSSLTRYARTIQKPIYINVVPQYNPVYEYRSDRTDIKLELTDSYQVRNEILILLKRNANSWLELALSRAPMELHSTLQVSTPHL